MYNPAYNRVDDPAVAFDLIEQVGFGHVISFGLHGFNSSALPLLVDRDIGRLGSLRGHFARANNQWKRVDATDVLVLFPLADGYVSPAWYPSKAEHGKVVPTWNYEVVHVHGVARVRDDVEWVRQLVTDLTDHHESSRTEQAGAPPWAVTDAPADYIEARLKGIVGVEIEITAIEAKRKLSQNRSAEDQCGVTEGLDASTRRADHALATAMRQTSG
jgi:transcriptional regulator